VTSDRLLLDTHLLIWWVTGNPIIQPGLRKAIEGATAFLSIVSTWEIAIKISVRKLDLPLTFSDLLEHVGFELLPLRLEHVRDVGGLPMHHRDPFDRMLIAQARVENLVLVTRDRQFDSYDVRTFWPT